MPTAEINAALIERVAEALRASRLSWGTHSDRWPDVEWQREFWTEAATIALTAARASLITEVALVLDQHRWKSMGVSSVECECGEICYGDESMTQFPADEAFRRHVAEQIVASVLSSDKPEEQP